MNPWSPNGSERRLSAEPRAARRASLTLTALALLAAAGCSALSRQPRPEPPSAAAPAQAEAVARGAALEDFSIKFSPDAAKPGMPRSHVESVLGPPDAVLDLGDDRTEALYAFFPDGGKFVNPGVGPRFFSHSAASAVDSPHLEAVRKQLTFYRIRYSVDGVVTAV